MSYIDFSITYLSCIELDQSIPQDEKSTVDILREIIEINKLPPEQRSAESLLREKELIVHVQNVLKSVRQEIEIDTDFVRAGLESFDERLKEINEQEYLLFLEHLKLDENVIIDHDPENPSYNPIDKLLLAANKTFTLANMTKKTPDDYEAELQATRSEMKAIQSNIPLISSQIPQIIIDVKHKIKIERLDFLHERVDFLKEKIEEMTPKEKVEATQNKPNPYPKPKAGSSSLVEIIIGDHCIQATVGGCVR